MAIEIKNIENEELRNVAERVASIANLEIEVCGKWLWVGGNTKPYAEQLKRAHLRWSPNKMKWYWRPADESGKHRHYRGKSSMEEIRRIYGSDKVEEVA